MMPQAVPQAAVAPYAGYGYAPQPGMQQPVMQQAGYGPQQAVMPQLGAPQARYPLPGTAAGAAHAAYVAQPGAIAPVAARPVVVQQQHAQQQQLPVMGPVARPGVQPQFVQRMPPIATPVAYGAAPTYGTPSYGAAPTLAVQPPMPQADYTRPTPTEAPTPVAGPVFAAAAPAKAAPKATSQPAPADPNEAVPSPQPDNVSIDLSQSGPACIAGPNGYAPGMYGNAGVMNGGYGGQGGVYVGPGGVYAGPGVMNGVYGPGGYYGGPAQPTVPNVGPAGAAVNGGAVPGAAGAAAGAAGTAAGAAAMGAAGQQANQYFDGTTVDGAFAGNGYGMGQNGTGGYVGGPATGYAGGYGYGNGMGGGYGGMGGVGYGGFGGVYTGQTYGGMGGAYGYGYGGASYGSYYSRLSNWFASYYNGCRTCGPWFASVAGMMLTRTQANNVALSHYCATPQTSVLNSSTAGQDQWVNGYEFRLGRAIGQRYAVEAVWWQTGTLAGMSNAVAPGWTNVTAYLDYNHLIDNGSPLSDITNCSYEQRIYRYDDFRNFELNLIQQALLTNCANTCNMTFFSGFRYFQFNETLAFWAVRNGTTFQPNDFNNQTNYIVRETNNLYGWQFGSRLTYMAGCRWRFFTAPRFGIFANNVQQLQHACMAFDATSSGTSTAVMGQLDSGVAYQILPCVSLFADYRVMGFSGVATSDDNWARNFQATNALTHINSSSSLILHGWLAGVQCQF
jgi:hypothetical protein